MRFISTTSIVDNYLTKDEWDELIVLKQAISDLPSSVHPCKMERFAELFAKSLSGKGNPTIQ